MTAPFDRRLASTPFAHAGYMVKLWEQLAWATTVVISPTPWNAGDMLRLLADEAITSLARDMARTVGKDAFVRQQTAIMARPDSRSLLPAIRCPTLVLCGAEDSVTPLDRHQEMAAAIEGARLEQVDGAGHLTPLEQPEVVTAALARWLAPL